MFGKCLLRCDVFKPQCDVREHTNHSFGEITVLCDNTHHTKKKEKKIRPQQAELYTRHTAGVVSGRTSSWDSLLCTDRTPPYPCFEALLDDFCTLVGQAMDAVMTEAIHGRPCPGPWSTRVGRGFLRPWARLCGLSNECRLWYWNNYFIQLGLICLKSTIIGCSPHLFVCT